MHKPSSIVVGIGASAGGFQALSEFLGPLTIHCGMGLVVIQHLDPAHKDNLVEMLGRTTALPVVPIQDGLVVEDGCVYVLPPGYDLRIHEGGLRLLEPTDPHNHWLPIDGFFRSLAADQGERAIAVILSGMGRDGCLGLRAIKAKDGASFVQDRESAKFDGMPGSAIDEGLADVVAPAGELAARITDYVLHLRPSDQPYEAPLDETRLNAVVAYLRDQSGHDFSHYKKGTTSRRIERRMSLLGLMDGAGYLRHLQENPQEAELLFKELLIGVTQFFRDPAVWQQLGDEILQGLADRLPEGGQLRAWVAGCSTGEEAYSLAIVFQEFCRRLRSDKTLSLHIFATDMDPEAITKARAGLYGPAIASEVSPERLRRFFVSEGQSYRIVNSIRTMITFAPHDVTSDPPFTRLNLVTCRNLFIYLEPELQSRVLQLFHYSLVPEGVLLLGGSESVGATTELFASIKGPERFYCRQDAPSGYLGEFRGVPSVGLTRASSLAAAGKTPLNLKGLTEAILLRQFSPVAALTTGTGDILYLHGRTGGYLEPPAGKANLNLFAMARPELSTPLELAFSQAVRRDKTVLAKGLPLKDGSVDITVWPVSSEATGKDRSGIATDVVPPRLMLVVFAKSAVAPAPEVGEKDPSGLAYDLETSLQELRALRQQGQDSREELNARNEEEQCLNEELMSSKEEMQSVNEELQTVNNELQAKVEELSRASDDMRNLLDSTDIATLFLDNKLRVRRFTARTATLFPLIASDTGRPITDLKSTLHFPGLVADVEQVLSSQTILERQLSASDERAFTVRIMPYRTRENCIDGVVMTFVDTTRALSHGHPNGGSRL